ncbi:MAG TPA: class I SAM-dependent methyltransferase [Thermoanaerobaculia bacterium]|nr:class I SAM-dependent methyltransferase [Thermoanaerobaculia bacterium]
MTSSPRSPADRPPPLDLSRFGDEPTRDLGDWHRLWREDLAFPIVSHRGPLGRLVVAVKRLLRPVFRAPVADLWDRQRVFNLILAEHVERLDALGRDLEHRLGDLEHFVPVGLDEALAHNDAVFARVDQKLDRYRREAHDLSAALASALAALPAAAERVGSGSPDGDAEPAALAHALDERAYLELERRYRGTEEEIAQRLERYLAWLTRAPAGKPVLDLGCGRGEALAVLAAAGVPARGVDSSSEMVARCRERGLEAEVGDLFAVLAAAAPDSLGGVVSFHVVEHLPPASISRLVQLARRALAPGGFLVLETPNPLSLVVAARSFWLDPTHVRPVHPESLRLLFELAGFDPVEHLELRPFAPSERLPEIDLASVAAEQQALADRVNRLRDHLDDLLYGDQDYALVGTRPTGS